ncbi:MAG: Mur ligase family protein [Bacilli bacterium]
MKLIGITGSCGKTSVAEIIYQYLLYCKKSVSMYTSNGLFVNGLTKQKDYPQTTMYRKDLDVNLLDDANSGCEFAIVEIAAESIKRRDTVHKLKFDVVILTSFFSTLHNHFKNKEEYLACKRNILLAPNVGKVLIRYENEEYSKFSDINHITYGYSGDANHRISVLDNKMDGLTLSFLGIMFQTNLITAYHARNIAAALATLFELDVLDMKLFSEFAKDIKIRGRFEKVVVGGKTVVIDTGLAGAVITLVGIEKPLDSTNYRIIFSNVHYKDANEWVLSSRERVGRYLKRGNYIYLTSPTNNPCEEEVFIQDVIKENNYSKYKFIPRLEEACKKALKELNPNEILIVFSRNHYREYRRIFEEINAIE